MKNKFFILGLPRSRTAWFAYYFNCIHEGLYYYPNYSDFMKSDNKGDSSTTYPLISDFIEDSPKVFIHRNIDDVKESLIKLFGFSPKELGQWDNEMRSADGLHIDYNSINDSLEKICEYIGSPFSKGKDYMKNIHIEDNFLKSEVESCLG